MRIIGGKRMRKAAVVVAVGLVAAAGVGCAQEAGDSDVVAGGPADFAATPEYLGRVVADSTGQPFRYDMTMSMQMAFGREELDIEAPVGTGSQDGDRSQMVMDLGAMFEQMADEMGSGAGPMPFDTDDMIMETIGDTEVMFLRSPFFGQIADQLDIAGSDDALGAAGDLFDAFADLGDAWGRVDLTALGDVAPGDIRNVSPTGQTFDPAAIFEIISEADEVEDLGRDEVDGTPVSGLAATVSFADMLEAQGVDGDELLSQAGQASGPGATAVEAMTDLELPVEAWIDDAGLVRRFSFTLDLAELMAAAAEGLPDNAPDDLPGGFQMGVSFDFYDYGDESIEIEFPDDAETVDLTEAYRGLFETP